MEIGSRMKTRAQRRHDTKRVIKKRLKLIKNLPSCNSPRYPAPTTYANRLAKTPHRVAKKHPLDCGKTKCLVCHAEKVLKRPPVRYRVEMDKWKDMFKLPE